MQTRAQKSAWKEVTAQHTCDLAAFAAAIAASLSTPNASANAPSVAVSNAPSAGSSGPLKRTASTFITPEKQTRKRKLRPSSSSSASAASSPPPSSLPLTVEPAEISPAARDTKRRTRSVRTTPTQPSATTTATATKATTIRRTLDYTDAMADTQHAPPAVAVPVEVPAAVPTWSSRAVLERMASGDATTRAVVIGRDDERRAIARVFAAAADAATRALFVVGPPGTGKSSSVAHVAAQHPTSVVVRVNCSTFATPAALFAAIGEQLTRHRIAPSLPPLDHAQALNTFLTTTLDTTKATKAAVAHHAVLVLDEVDHLVQLPAARALLAFFVRWAHRPNATLRFVGILNGVDMHAQIVECLARDGNGTHTPHHEPRVVLFPSYALDELVAILDAYVQSAITTTSGSHDKLDDVVEPRALELIARKVAARDGDARRAVGLLRQCARLCLTRSDQASPPSTEPTTGTARLGVRDVLKCTSAVIASQLSVTKQIQQLPRAPKLLLFGVTRLAPCETTTATLSDVCDELQTLQATQPSLAWLPKFRLEELQQHLGALECYALVKQTAPGKSRSAWHAKLTSTVAMDTLARAFHDDELLAQLPTH